MKNLILAGLATVAVSLYAEQTGTSGKVDRAISINTFAVSKVDDSKQKNTMVAVPWTSYFTNFTDVASMTNLPVAKVVNSLNLVEGDQLVMYLSNKVFRVWTLYVNSDGSSPWWKASAIYTSRRGESEDASKHQNDVIARGYSLWLKRANVEHPFFVHGQYEAPATTIEIAGGESAMIGNVNTSESLPVNSLQYTGGTVGPDDRLSLPGNSSAARILYWNGEKWYYTKDVKVEDPVSHQQVVSQVRCEDAVIPPGRGCWYVRKADAPITIKIPGTVSSN